MLRLVAVMLGSILSACSAGSDGSMDASPEPTMPGRIIVRNEPPTSSIQRPNGFAYAEAGFSAAEGNCPSPSPDSCLLNACVNGPPWASAGVITLVGFESPLTFTPSDQKTYSVLNSATAVFGGGEELSVEATGADVPPFSISLDAPVQATVTSPAIPSTALMIDRSEDLAISWTGGSGLILVRFTNYMNTTTGRADVLECAYSADAGAASIPSSQLLLLRACTSSMYCRFEMASASKARVAAGAWGVNFNVRNVAVWPDNTLAEVGTVMH